MQEIVEELEKRVKNNGLKVVETLYDGFTYFMAVENQKGVYVIYTTKGFYKYRKNCLRVVLLSEHIPFGDIFSLVGGNFVPQYLKVVSRSGKCIVYYDSYFSIDDLIELLKT